jgi:serine phosphatase RsbU (regulator of sigma subunit)
MHFIIIFFLFFSCSLKAQNGLLPINNFGPKQYGMHSSSNWCIAQDQLGLMYFGNANGVLQYDGINWRFISVKYGTYVRTMKADNNGRIYVGCYGEFGYLSTDEFGLKTYVSISSSLPNIKNKFKDIIKIHCIADDVYFQSEEGIFIYNPKTNLKTILPETSFHTSFSLEGKIYVRQRNKGLFELKEQRLQFINGSEVFAEKGIFSMMEYGKTGIMILTHDNGCFLMKNISGNISFSELKTDDSNFIYHAKIYGGIKLRDGNFAINSLTSGAIIMDKLGYTKAKINKQSGIIDDDIKEIFQDKQENLWLVTNNGISMIVWNSPISSFSGEFGLEGSVHDLFKLNNLLYVATSNGLYYADLLEKPSIKFRRVEHASRNQFWEISFDNNQLIAAGIDGIYLIQNLKAKRVFEERCRTAVFDNSNKVWIIGGEEGLTLLEENWTKISRIHEMNVVIIKIIKESLTEGDRFWISSLQNGLSLLELDLSLKPIINYIGFPEGAKNEFIHPFKFKDKILLGTEQGLFTYSNGRFELSSQFLDNEKFKNTSFLKEEGNGVWMVNNNHIQIYYPQQDHSKATPFLAIDKGQLLCLFPDANQAWIGAHEGLIKYDYNAQKNYQENFLTLIRSIWSKNDSLLYDGNLPTIEKKITLPFSLNSLKIEFAAMYFEEATRTQYSTLLEGYDKAWSSWSFENKINFNNLPEGHYKLYVKSQNVYGKISNAGVFSFSILPPWFRTWWAYTCYVIMSISSIVALIRYRTNSLQLEKRKLEQIVQERTTVVVAQRDEILKQKQVLDIQHQEITDSINYAHKIQSSLLGSERLLKKNLKEYFAILLPRNVVSGDFYWATELSNHSFLLAIADSTGHGVPGAIMSILNIACLKDAIEADKQINPAQILNDTRKRIINSLKGESEEVDEGRSDGMDCCLISLDVEKRILIYAGANLPLWIVRSDKNGNKKLLEYNPDRMPVGKYTSELSTFNELSIQLEKGDMIYSFTDGFADQFGGPKGKKFKYKALGELLLAHSHLPLEIQKQLFKDTFIEWKGNEEQTDDVCLIGFRV